MKKLIERIKFRNEIKKNGWVAYSCPSCGTWLGAVDPMCVRHFECGKCGAIWECKNADELFEKAYPDAGKEENDE